MAFQHQKGIDEKNEMLRGRLSGDHVNAPTRRESESNLMVTIPAMVLSFFAIYLLLKDKFEEEYQARVHRREMDMDVPAQYMYLRIDFVLDLIGETLTKLLLLPFRLWGRIFRAIGIIRPEHIVAPARGLRRRFLNATEEAGHRVHYYWALWTDSHVYVILLNWYMYLTSMTFLVKLIIYPYCLWLCFEAAGWIKRDFDRAMAQDYPTSPAAHYFGTRQELVPRTVLNDDCTVDHYGYTVCYDPSTWNVNPAHTSDAVYTPWPGSEDAVVTSTTDAVTTHYGQTPAPVPAEAEIFPEVRASMAGNTYGATSDPWISSNEPDDSSSGNPSQPNDRERSRFSRHSEVPATTPRSLVIHSKTTEKRTSHLSRQDDVVGPDSQSLVARVRESLGLGPSTSSKSIARTVSGWLSESAEATKAHAEESHVDERDFDVLTSPPSAEQSSELEDERDFDTAASPTGAERSHEIQDSQIDERSDHQSTSSARASRPSARIESVRPVEILKDESIPSVHAGTPKDKVSDSSSPRPPTGAPKNAVSRPSHLKPPAPVARPGLIDRLWARMTSKDEFKTEERYPSYYSISKKAATHDIPPSHELQKTEVSEGGAWKSEWTSSPDDYEESHIPPPVSEPSVFSHVRLSQQSSPLDHHDESSSSPEVAGSAVRPDTTSDYQPQGDTDGSEDSWHSATTFTSSQQHEESPKSLPIQGSATSEAIRERSTDKEKPKKKTLIQLELETESEVCDQLKRKMAGSDSELVVEFDSEAVVPKGSPLPKPKRRGVWARDIDCEKDHWKHCRQCKQLHCHEDEALN
ncbi:hypothetical protein AAFC00_007311 [Neodothiora populina]|uniref:Uncharacterized protein n=1 Tax=Neodothiora populina TaxID=2781224 RepID=A0ABR3PJ08_9PEZI